MGSTRQTLDIFGYSRGAAVALRAVIRHPRVLRELVLASITYEQSSIHPGHMQGLENMQREQMA